MVPKPPTCRRLLPSSYRSLPAFFSLQSPHFINLRPPTDLNIKGPVENSPPSYGVCYEVLKLSASHGSFDGGRAVHGCMIKQGFSGRFLQLQLFNVYVKGQTGQSLGSAYRLFVELPRRDAVSWNMLISGFNRWGDESLDTNFFIDTAGFEELRCFTGWHFSIFAFKRMLGEMVLPDYITFVSVLSACACLDDVGISKQVHCYVTKCGFCSISIVGTCIIDIYAKCGSVKDAAKMFDVIEARDVVVWNVIVSCYNLNGLYKEAFQMFEQMRLEGLRGDGFTFSTLLNSCSGLRWGNLGRQMQALVIRSGYEGDVLIGSAIVDMYAKSNNMMDAGMAFNQMVARNIVSWATLIVGYGNKGDGNEAVRMYKQMLMDGFKPDEIILASLLSSCANMAADSGTEQLHTHVIRFGFHSSLSATNALLIAYSKCGSIADALKCFKLISTPDVVSWSSLISSYAFHGLIKEALDSFEKMKLEGIKPDGNAYLAILSACRHAGLLVEGLQYFELMRKEDKICPAVEHYTCVVDLLSRAGRLQEAQKLLCYIPLQSNTDALRSFIASCQVHLNLKLAIWATEILIIINPGESTNYKLMANLYAAIGRWDDAAKIRKLMTINCVNVMSGSSWIDIKSVRVHTCEIGKEYPSRGMD